MMKHTILFHDRSGATPHTSDLGLSIDNCDLSTHAVASIQFYGDADFWARKKELEV